MTNDTPTYETPALIDIGEFTDLTLGWGGELAWDGAAFGIWT